MHMILSISNSHHPQMNDPRIPAANLTMSANGITRYEEWLLEQRTTPTTPPLKSKFLSTILLVVVAGLALMLPSSLIGEGEQEGAALVPESESLRTTLYSGELGFNQLMLIKRSSIDPSHVYTYHQEGLKPGGGLYRLTLNEEGGLLEQFVDATEGVILDANISFDGKTMMFSWKKSMSETFQIYTITIDGTDLKQVTVHDSNNFNGCWLPDGGIAFLSDRKPAFAYCWKTTTPILYRSKVDGSELVRLSANYLNDFTPAVMNDGRILYSRWEYVDKPAIPIQSLWTINQDGTGLSGYFGNRVLSPATFMEARQIPGTRKVLCVLTSHNGPCRGGIGIVDYSKGGNAQEAIENITPEIDIGQVNRGNDGNRIRGTGTISYHSMIHTMFPCSVSAPPWQVSYCAKEFATSPLMPGISE